MKGCLMLFCGCVFVLTGLGMLKGEETPAKGSTKIGDRVSNRNRASGQSPPSMPERFAEVTGIFFELAGMEQVELATIAFTAPKTDDTAKIADAFALFICKQSLKTEYAVFCQILAGPVIPLMDCGASWSIKPAR